MLQVLLTLDRATNVFVTLDPDKTFQAVSLGKSVCRAFPMLPGAAREVAGDTNAKCAIGPIGNNIDASTRHSVIVALIGCDCNRGRDGTRDDQIRGLPRLTASSGAENTVIVELVGNRTEIYR